jgi:hypothetical protein
MWEQSRKQVEQTTMWDDNIFKINKKFWEELIAYIPYTVY